MTEILGHVDALSVCRRIVFEDRRLSGMELIRRIGINLGRELGMRWVLIGRFDGDQVVHSDFMVRDAVEEEPVSFALEGSILQGLQDRRCVCIAADQGAKDFPRDSLLQRTEAKSYAGAPLLTPDGEMLGGIVMLHDDALPLGAELVEGILEFVSARVAVEFERDQGELPDYDVQPAGYPSDAGEPSSYARRDVATLDAPSVRREVPGRGPSAEVPARPGASVGWRLQNEGSWPISRLSGIRVSRLDQHQTLELLERWMGEDRPRRVATANVDFLQRAGADSALRNALQTADLVTADGAPLVMWSRMLGESIPERVAGSDLIEPLAARAARDGRRVFLLGGLAGAAKDTARLLMEQNPSLRLAGFSDVRVDLDDEFLCRRIAADVRATGAHLLLVGLGSPKQELFLQRYLEMTGARVGIGVGASFDFLSGRVRRAPKWLQKLGLEWAFRAATDPKRLGLRYMRNIPYALRMTAGLAMLPRPRSRAAQPDERSA